MKADTRHLLRGPLAVAGAVLLLAVPAFAQSTADDGTASGPQQFDSASAPEQLPPPIPATPPPQLKAPQWSATAGFEGDTHNTGYGFAGPTYSRPIRRNVSIIGTGNVNYLYYEYPSGAETTRVHSPGFAVLGGVKFGDENYFEVDAGPSVKRRHSQLLDVNDNVISTTEDTLFGVDFNSEVWVDPTKHNNVYGIYNYSSQDGYQWARLAYKEQLANRNWDGKITPYLGIEGVTQGNRDVRSQQFGPFVEFVHVPTATSIMFRGGWKRSTYQVGPDKTGPWFAIGFWHRL